MDIVVAGWIVVIIILICGLVLLFFSYPEERKLRQLESFKKRYKEGKLNRLKILKNITRISQIRIIIKIILIIVIPFTILSLLTLIFVWGTVETDFQITVISFELVLIFTLFMGLRFLNTLDMNFEKLLEERKTSKE